MKIYPICRMDLFCRYDEEKSNRSSDMKRCFSLIYQGNHVFIIPKKTMDQEQLQTFTSLMKDKVGDAYVDTVSK